MTIFKVALIILGAICIIGKIAIGWCISQMFEDIRVMRHEYLDLLNDACTDKKVYLKEWGVALEGWKKTLNEWGETIQIFTDYVHEKGDEQDGQT